ncbi:MAG: hypothetical protein A3B16_01025 [Candidatus Zambryskibacteria bacterium RIFCSPLOWO2_01_FULL_45_43]|uniref:FAD/NAD(P)-binding domain-containing protein n=2 Tax=Parcubacteria group TaxID=1794811 RepID=A0A1G1ZRX6_9BACT|nr:MAG: hypothetical protein A3H63_00210 [Candidatus Harrisonbacteria bacterium RIFCSPLOWO2_02_FULL_45_10c]OHB05650.1 MAG: hypothetical protein A3B16_01025 [Candidatus Zambryskibacteria bacterium RIFCSPLOWO2_01_FULL_45_43]
MKIEQAKIKKNIVILGAGFGGIAAAFEIAKKLGKFNLEGSYELILADKNDYHTYTPTLYEIATTSKNLANQMDLKSIATFPLKTIFLGKRITILKKTVSELDLIDGDIHFTGGEKLPFDYLVLALGSESNYFNIPGLKEHSLPLKSFLDALKIRDLIWQKVESGEKNIKIVIGGGGSTGVELAGEIKSWLCQLEEEFSKCDASVQIIEGAPSILPGFNQKIINKVSERLRKIGVELLLNELIEKVEPWKAILKSGRIVEFDVLIWTGGVKSASLMGTLPLKKEQRGRVEVVGEMECFPQSPNLNLYGKIYGLGDAICFYDPLTGKPVPLIAEAAIKEAKVASHNLMEEIKLAEGLTAKPDYQKYNPAKEFPYMIPVGGKYAVAKIGPLIISGLLGWVVKGLVEINYLLLNVLPPIQAFKVWLKGLWIFVKNDRLG